MIVIVLPPEDSTLCVGKQHTNWKVSQAPENSVSIIPEPQRIVIMSDC